MRKAMLVYQAGIANIFNVKCFNLSEYGREAIRIYQGDFRSAENICKGLSLAGVPVRISFCNKAGDIINQTWNTDHDSAPFSESMYFDKSWLK